MKYLFIRLNKMQKGYKKFTILINEPFCLEMSKVYLLDP